ncbi:MAG: LexA family protein [Planctomycetota bacterium]|jgi:repressor LexA
MDYFSHPGGSWSIGNYRSQIRSETRQLWKSTKPKYTPLQGQYLAFIYYYTKLHKLPPAESDFVRYFKKTPPAIHQMIMKLEELGFITKIPEKARSIQLLISKDELPDLE